MKGGDGRGWDDCNGREGKRDERKEGEEGEGRAVLRGLRGFSSERLWVWGMGYGQERLGFAR